MLNVSCIKSYVAVCYSILLMQIKFFLIDLKTFLTYIDIGSKVYDFKKIGGSMRAFLFLIFFLFCFNSFLFACSGSCLLCHEKLNLKEPKEHRIIAECISCHQKGCGEDSFLKEKSSDTSCGSDCFDCHKTLPQDFTHKQIVQCVKCHDKLNSIR